MKIVINSRSNRDLETLSLGSIENLHENFKKLILDIKSNKNPKESEKYQNISYTDDQLREAISRLYIYFADNKIDTLIKVMDESNDLSILEDLEHLKKKIEFYQNTL